MRAQVPSSETVRCPISNEIGHGMDAVGKLVQEKVAQVTKKGYQKQRMERKSQQYHQRNQQVFPGMKGTEHMAIVPLVLRIKDIRHMVYINQDTCS